MSLIFEGASTGQLDAEWSGPETLPAKVRVYQYALAPAAGYTGTAQIDVTLETSATVTPAAISMGAAPQFDVVTPIISAPDWTSGPWCTASPNSGPPSHKW